MLLLLFEQLVTRRREWKQGLQKGEGRIEPTEQPTPDKRLIRLVSSVPAGAQCFAHRVRGRMVRLPFETVECELDWAILRDFSGAGKRQGQAADHAAQKNNIKHGWGVTVEFRRSRVHHMPQHKILVSQSLYQSGAT